MQRDGELLQAVSADALAQRKGNIEAVCRRDLKTMMTEVKEETERRDEWKDKLLLTETKASIVQYEHNRKKCRCFVQRVMRDRCTIQKKPKMKARQKARGKPTVK